MTSYFCDRPHKLSWALVIIVINCFVDGWYLHIYSPDGSAAPARWLSYLWKQCTTISNFHVTLHFDLPARKLVVSYTWGGYLHQIVSFWDLFWTEQAKMDTWTAQLPCAGVEYDKCWRYAHVGTLNGLVYMILNASSISLVAIKQ